MKFIIPPKIFFAVVDISSLIGPILYVIEQLAFVGSVILVIVSGVQWSQGSPQQAKYALMGAAVSAAAYPIASIFYTKFGMPVPSFTQ